MDRDRFHNQLALSIGYKLINDKHFTLEVEDSDDPWLTLKIKGHDDIRFRASDNANDISYESLPELKPVVELVHKAYLEAIKPF